MNPSITMKDIPETQRPYEKCFLRGPSELTDAELLSVVLRTGTRGESALQLAQRILCETGRNGLLGLHRFSLNKLMRIRGIGKVKAIQLLCITELAKRMAKSTYSESVLFTDSSSVATYYMEDLRHENQEILKLLMLNSKSKLIGETDISKGTVNASVITPRELFIEALQKNAVSIIILHNHPSGSPMPSREDILITKRIREAGNLIGIELLDHIIIGDKCYYSFLEEHILENT